MECGKKRNEFVRRYREDNQELQNVMEKIRERIGENPNYFITFKRDFRARVYGYGGRVCDLPDSSNPQMDLFDPGYLKYLQLGEEDAGEYKKDAEIYEESNWKIVDTMMRNRAYLERMRENVIASQNKILGKNKIAIVDMEFPSRVEAGNQPKADLVGAYVDDENRLCFSFIEYKCTQAGIKGDANNLCKHYDDMVQYYGSRDIKEQVLKQLRLMVSFGNIEVELPEGFLEKIGDVSEIKTNITFLFTHAEELILKRIPQNLKNDYSEKKIEKLRQIQKEKEGVEMAREERKLLGGYGYLLYQTKVLGSGHLYYLYLEDEYQPLTIDKLKVFREGKEFDWIPQ